MSRKLRYSHLQNSALSNNPQHRFANNHALLHYASGAVYSFIPKNGCMIEREVDGKQETVKRIMFKPTKAK